MVATDAWKLCFIFSCGALAFLATRHTVCLYIMQVHTFSTHGLTATPAPITLTGPSVTINYLITSVTCETTSVSLITHSYSTRTT